MSLIHVIDYAKSFLGTPYIYGGNSKITGLDCSGLVCEILRSCGVIGKEDLSAQMIFNKLNERTTRSITGPGAVAFYGKSITEVSHVAFHLDRFLVIEAGGGDHTITELRLAVAKNACVRVRKYNYRADYLCSLMPDYSVIGMI